MAFYEKYSPVLANLLAMWLPDYEYDSYTVDQIITAGMPHIFDFDYPIWSNDYKNVLQTKILKHYYTHEIATETPDLFKLYLDDRLNMIMPYYNQLYASTQLKFDPLVNYDEKETYNKTGTQNKNGTQNRDSNSDSTRDNSNTITRDNTANSQRIFSDTPQAPLAGLDYATTLTKDSGTLKDTASDTGSETFNSTDTENIKNTETLKSTDDFIRAKSGNLGENYSEMLLKFRDTIINIDAMIINELRDLFMVIY